MDRKSYSTGLLTIAGIIYKILSKNYLPFFGFYETDTSFDMQMRVNFRSIQKLFIENLTKKTTDSETDTETKYHTSAISCSLYFFCPIFHCSLYCRAVIITDIYEIKKGILLFFGIKSEVCI